MIDEETINDGKVECKVCGKRFNMITPQHVKMHGMTIQEYKDTYPDAKLSGETFSAKQRYKNKKMFDENENENKIEDNVEEINKQPFEDFPLPDDSDELSNLNINVNSNKKSISEIETEDFVNKFSNYNLDNLEKEKLKQEGKRKFEKIRLNHKKDIALFLNNIFPDIIHDYFVEIKNHEDHLLYRLVTDFGSQRNKVVFFFPDTFWHNEESPVIENKYRILKDYGWRVIEIRGMDIVDKLKKYFKK